MMKRLIEAATKRFRQPASLVAVMAVLSLFNLVAFHLPLFELVVGCVEPGANAWLIVCSFVVLILAANFMVYYLLVYTLRVVGKVLVALTFVCNSVALYFVNTYEVLMTRDMMGNLFNTRLSEASGFFSLTPVVYLLLLGLPPCLYLFVRRYELGSLRRMLVSVGAAIGLIVVVAVANMGNILWIDHNAPRIGSLFMPWSYVANTVRHFNHQRMINRQEILLPDATIASDDRVLCVLVIGESARRENFSLYGYERRTNPLLEADSVVTYVAEASATSTTAAVKAIVDHKPTDELYEILPNYLYRNGVDVVWRTTNWGEPPLHIAKHHTLSELKAQYPEADGRYDAILLEGLADEIAASQSDKLLVVLHTSTSHGPTYFKKYPEEFERFAPVCTTVEMAKADRAELINAYDNTILYTDYLLHSVIELLRSVDDRKSAMIYISDHGESLGEGNVYMHGMVSAAMAPKEQTEIPFIVWRSGSDSKLRSLDKVGHYHIFHSVMDFLDVESEVYDERMSIFE